MSLIPKLQVKAAHCGHPTDQELQWDSLMIPGISYWYLEADLQFLAQLCIWAHFVLGVRNQGCEKLEEWDDATVLRA